MNDKELRTVEFLAELRSDESDQVVLTGYALKFNRWSKLLYGYFREQLDPNCLTNSDMSECVLLINHDYNLVLGRKNVNLNLYIDEVGLRFECTPTNTSYSRDLIENMKAGIVTKCSFGFTVKKEKWENNNDEETQDRTILEIDKLYDVSIVTNPAYDDTNADVFSKRCLDGKDNLSKETYERMLIDLEVNMHSMKTV